MQTGQYYYEQPFSHAGGLMPQTSTGYVSEAPKASAFDMAFSELRARVDDLAKVASDLEQRLSTVLTPNPPQAGANGNSAPTPLAAPIVDMTASINARLSAIALHLENIKGRLAV